MTIEVRCPNGHLLACPDERAGKQGKCPKCGTMFQVPLTNGAAVAAAEPARRQPSPPSDVAEPPLDKAAAARAATKHIVFLCPNGHKLNGPASLQGQPGQCPHCGAKFRIPVYAAGDEIEGEPDDGGESTHIGEAGDFDLELEDDAPEIEENFDDELETVEEFEAEDDPFPGRRAAGGDPFFAALEQTPDTIHPMARLFATLWNERIHGGIIEINLEDGVTLVPDWWAQRLSLEAYGVFATQTADGSYVMEAVAWDHVKRVTVRRITELPDGVFE